MSPFSFRRCVHFPTPGGDERDRTADPLLARQVLSQLSYTPMSAKCLYIISFSAKCVNYLYKVFQKKFKDFSANFNQKAQRKNESNFGAKSGVASEKTRLWKICTKISVFCFKSFTKRRNCAKIIYVWTINSAGRVSP